MTDLEKKLRNYHRRKIKYAPDSKVLLEKLEKRENNKSTNLNDEPFEDPYIFDKSNDFLRRRKRMSPWTRIWTTLVAILIIIILAMIARTAFLTELPHWWLWE